MKNNQPMAEYASAMDKFHGKETIHSNMTPSNSKIRVEFCPQGLSLLFAGVSAANKKTSLSAPFAPLR